MRGPAPTPPRGAQAALPAGRKRAVYLGAAALWLTGALWLWLKNYGQLQGPFGPEPRPLQAWTLKAHGAAAMAFLLVLGSLLADHVPAGWQRRGKRPNGVLLLSVNGALAATGWALYYVAAEDARRAASVAHWSLGLALPLLIAFHVWYSRRRGRGAGGTLSP